MSRRFSRWDSLDVRFWSQIDKTDGCWLWTGPKTPSGYGASVGHAKRRWYAHQLSYHLLVGVVPDGLVLDHLCRVRHCVRPDHLEPVTALENIRRGVEARWVETCPNGHDPAQFRRTLPSGKNVCVRCRQESDNKRNENNYEDRAKAKRAAYAGRADRAPERRPQAWGRRTLDGLGLLPRQRDILVAIVSLTDVLGEPPTRTEVARAVGLKSGSTITYAVQQLVAQGWLRKPRPFAARTLVVVDPERLSQREAAA